MGQQLVIPQASPPGLIIVAPQAVLFRDFHLLDERIKNNPMFQKVKPSKKEAEIVKLYNETGGARWTLEVPMHLRNHVHAEVYTNFIHELNACEDRLLEFRVQMIFGFGPFTGPTAPAAPKSKLFIPKSGKVWFF
eukprot:TRINITY_DN5151_c0_g3_i1.p1 TRINITY_DN5151_c0_g3~~TRINITY_DN5151_c0_g3_i1.p1  ORF type:complete len:135 (+),score=7.61 TRINITY_DN5151_c0_g3_i1:184-588(+)